jgi:hypothetical protein
LDEAIFPAREDRLKQTPDNNGRRSRDGSGKNIANLHNRKQEDGNEAAFAHVCISNARLRSDFGSDKIDASNAAFRCRRSRLEMQQVGVDYDDLLSESRCPLFPPVKGGSRAKDHRSSSHGPHKLGRAPVGFAGVSATTARAEGKLSI